jgi:hypothetical protein
MPIKAVGLVVACLVLVACSGHASRSEPSPCRAATPVCRQARTIADRAANYEDAGIPQADAICFATQLVRFKPKVEPLRDRPVTVAEVKAQQRQLAECHIDHAAIDKIVGWNRRQQRP